jgi:hypothetical protein
MAVLPDHKGHFAFKLVRIIGINVLTADPRNFKSYRHFVHHISPTLEISFRSKVIT